MSECVKSARLLVLMESARVRLISHAMRILTGFLVGTRGGGGKLSYASGVRDVWGLAAQ